MWHLRRPHHHQDGNNYIVKAALLYLHDIEKLLGGASIQKRPRRLECTFNRGCGSKKEPAAAAQLAFTGLSLVPKLRDLSLLLHGGHENLNNSENLDCCNYKHSENLDYCNTMLAPPSILLHSNSLDHGQQQEGKMNFETYDAPWLIFSILKFLTFNLLTLITLKLDE